MTIRDKYQRYATWASECTAIAEAIYLLGWDQRTYMPAGGAAARGVQTATLSALKHQRQTDPEYLALLEELLDCGELDEDETCNVRESLRLLRRAHRVPESLIRERARVSSIARESWVRAREENSFSVVREDLAALVRINREYAQAITDDGGDLYESLLDYFEPHAKVSEIRTLFDELVPSLKSLRAEIAGSDKSEPIPNPAKAGFPRAAQEEFFANVLSCMGFDLSKGRLDQTIHPFCTDIGPGDVRLTTNYDESDICNGLYAVMHEAGHGIYNQCLRSDVHGLPLSFACSLGAHESQSLLWERHVGKSPAFVNYLYPQLVKLFPQALGDVSADVFYRYANQISPSLIRIHADEINYHLHIVLRFELEQQLVSGDLRVDDLSDAWNELTLQYLDVTPPDELHGVLQDTHWYTGMIGYFPTYSLGAVYAAQLFEAFSREVGGFEQQLKSGELGELNTWLTDRVHRHGRRYAAPELIERATNSAPTAQPLIRYLREKYTALYNL